MVNELGIKLKSLRLSKNLLQKEVAAKLGVSDRTLGNYENGMREPNLEAIKKLAKYYEVTTDYLLGQNNNANTLIPKEFSEAFENNHEEITFFCRMLKELPNDVIKNIKNYALFELDKYKPTKR